jgi:flagellar motor switch protein FliM
MSGTLTPDQVADFVIAAKRGESASHAGGEARRARRIRPLDFSRPMKLSPVEQGRFENAHANFSRDASMRLSSELRSPIELEVTSFAQLTWAAALRDVPRPSVLAVASTAPLGTAILICIQEPLLVAMIERLLGGLPVDPPASRSRTEIDMALTRRIFGSLTEALSVVWQELLALRLSFVDVEPQHANVELVPPSEPTLALTIEGRDESVTAGISLLVPYSATAEYETERGDAQRVPVAVRVTRRGVGGIAGRHANRLGEQLGGVCDRSEDGELDGALGGVRAARAVVGRGDRVQRALAHLARQRRRRLDSLAEIVVHPHGTYAGRRGSGGDQRIDPQSGAHQRRPAGKRTRDLARELGARRHLLEHDEPHDRLRRASAARSLTAAVPMPSTAARRS